MKPLVLLFALATPLLVHAQPSGTSDTMTDEEAVRATIVALFDGMRASDSSAVRGVFHDDATLRSVFRTESGLQLQQGRIADFVTSIGQSPVGALDEQIGAIAVQLDAGLAHAWMDYDFYYQGQRSHCGVNSMQLVKTASGDWQILNVVDTRRRDCE